MKKVSAILAMILALTMVSVPVLAAEINIVLTPDVTIAQPGDTITIDFTYTPAGTAVLALGCDLHYDASLVTLSKSSGWTVKDKGGYHYISIDNAESFEGTFKPIEFTVNDGVSGVAEFYVDDVTDLFDDNYDDHTWTSSKVSVQIGDGGSSEPDPETVFTVDKVVDGSAVKVTVANAEKASAGKIYVATFNGDVLVDCQVQDIANGTLTFSGLEGDIATAKMFVWDNLMIPITYATSAQ